MSMECKIFYLVVYYSNLLGSICLIKTCLVITLEREIRKPDCLQISDVNY